MTEETDPQTGVHRDRLFRGMCCALLPTAFSFVLVSNILGQLKREFILTNAQVGAIGGAALWGMAISLLVFGPLVEAIGLKRGAKGAFFGHLIGVTLFLAAAPFSGHPDAFWILLFGALGMGIGNGLIEVTGNPLTVALFPKAKTTKLNHFHSFFPGGMVVGGVLGFLLVKFGPDMPVNIGHWTVQIALVYIPIIIYGVMLLPEKFPKTETAEVGMTLKEIVFYALTHPLMWLMLFLKMATLSLELGSMRWIPEVLTAAGVPGVLVFAWLSGLMCILRLFAGPFVEKLSPTGMLLSSAVLTGIALYLFSIFESGIVPLMLAATVFALGVAFFFPTMVGFVSERIPKAGSFGMVLMMGLGFLVAGWAQTLMGGIADNYLPEALNTQRVTAVLEEVTDRFPQYLQRAEAAADDPQALAELGYRAIDVQNALEHSRRALNYYEEHESLSGNLTGNALRAISDLQLEEESELIQDASGMLRPADNYGGRMAFRWIAPFAFIVAAIFLVMFINDKRKGGYKAEALTSSHKQG